MENEQKHCDSSAVYRYTWPGKDEAKCCVIHAMQLKQVASAIGLPLQIIAIPVEDYTGELCSQKVAS